MSIVFVNQEPFAAFTDDWRAYDLFERLNGRFGGCFVSGCPVDPSVEITDEDAVSVCPSGDEFVVVRAGERRVSGAAGRGPVTLSPNGNKKE